MFVRSQDYRVDINFEISKVSIPAIYKNTLSLRKMLLLDCQI